MAPSYLEEKLKEAMGDEYEDYCLRVKHHDLFYTMLTFIDQMHPNPLDRVRGSRMEAFHTRKGQTGLKLILAWGHKHPVPFKTLLFYTPLTLNPIQHNLRCDREKYLGPTEFMMELVACTDITFVAEEMEKSIVTFVFNVIIPDEFEIIESNGYTLTFNGETNIIRLTKI